MFTGQYSVLLETAFQLKISQETEGSTGVSPTISSKFSKLKLDRTNQETIYITWNAIG